MNQEGVARPTMRAAGSLQTLVHKREAGRKGFYKDKYIRPSTGGNDREEQIIIYHCLMSVTLQGYRSHLAGQWRQLRLWLTGLVITISAPAVPSVLQAGQVMC